MLHVATLFAGGRSRVIVAIGMGSPLAARPLVAEGALGAVHAAEARQSAIESVAWFDVGGAVLTEHTQQHVSWQIRGRQRFECGGQSHREAPPRRRQGHGREGEAGARAIHEIGITRLAADLIIVSSVKRPCRAAAVVQFLGAAALGGGTERAWVTNDRACRTVFADLARLTRKNV